MNNVDYTEFLEIIQMSFTHSSRRPCDDGCWVTVVKLNFAHTFQLMVDCFNHFHSQDAVSYVPPLECPKTAVLRVRNTQIVSHAQRHTQPISVCTSTFTSILRFDRISQTCECLFSHYFEVLWITDSVKSCDYVLSVRFLCREWGYRLP